MTYSPHILALATCAPTLSQSQEEVMEKVIQSIGPDSGEANAVRRIYRGSQIQTRHSVIEDYRNDALTGSFFGNSFPESAPGMSQRNEEYKMRAPSLAHGAAEKALSEWGGRREDITHVVSVSCTGIMAPGIEFHLIDSLGLRRATKRLGINFMGCFGAFKGLEVAKALSGEDPAHRILVVCTELCSLHFHLDGNMDTHVANALFADGAAAVIVGQGREANRPLFELVRQESFALRNSLDLMTWEAADRGLVMRLSSEVPNRISDRVSEFARKLLGPEIAFSECAWAIHPGGKAIIRCIEEACALTSNQTNASWNVMRDFGNMSSATFFFVLDDLIRKPFLHEYSIGLGFGPGLSMEGVLLRRTAK